MRTSATTGVKRFRGTGVQPWIGPFTDRVSPAEQVALEDALAEMVIGMGLPFSFTEHPLAQKFLKAIRPAFKLPSAYQMSNTLLFRVYTGILVTVLHDIKAAPSLTLTTDTWSRVQGSLHVLNFMACGYGFAHFLDVAVAGTEQVRAYHLTWYTKERNAWDCS